MALLLVWVLLTDCLLWSPQDVDPEEEGETDAGGNRGVYSFGRLLQEGAASSSIFLVLEVYQMGMLSIMGQVGIRETRQSDRLRDR